MTVETRKQLRRHARHKSGRSSKDIRPADIRHCAGPHVGRGKGSKYPSAANDFLTADYFVLVS